VSEDEIKQRLRFETLAAFVRDMASYTLGDNDDEVMLREWVEQAQWLKAEIIDKEDL
jgi:hypothetical protein